MNELRDPVEAALEVLRPVPPSERQQEHRAAFLDEVHRVSISPDVRLEQMNGRREERRMTNRRIRRNLLLIAILIALFVAGGVLAQEIIDFFTQGEDDTMTFEYYPADSDFVTRNTPSPIEEADLDVLMPTYIPEAYTFETASYTSAGGSRLNYRCGDVWAFSIEQRRVAPDEIPDIRREVGASAVIETTQIGDVTGQYVRGHWLSFPSRTDSSNATPGTPISRPALWTNLSGWQQLVWYANGFLFKIATSGGLTNSIAFPPCSLSKADYVAIANGLQPASEVQVTRAPTVVAYPTVESPRLFTRANRDETAFIMPDYNDVLPSIVTNIASVDEAVTLAGYDIPEPNYLPGDFALTRINYAGALNRVLLGYDNSAEGYSSVEVIIMPVENFRSEDAQAFFAQFDTVGRSAVVQQVPIRDTMGEFVIGWWTWNPTVAQRTQVYTATYAPGDQQPMRWVSDQDTAHRILRWEENGYVFQIRASEALGTPFTLEQLLRVAESMQ